MLTELGANGHKATEEQIQQWISELQPDPSLMGKSWDEMSHADRAVFLSHFNQKSNEPPLVPKQYVDPFVGDYIIDYVNKHCDKQKMADIREEMAERQAILDEAAEAKAAKDRWFTP